MTSEAMRVLLVDPSLFTAPYDAALTEGLVAAGVEPRWAVRPLRPGDREEIGERHQERVFYRRVDGMAAWPAIVRAFAKGLSHARGLVRLAELVRRRKPHVVHFQWAVLPPLDALAMLLIRRQCAVVLTVHDTTPFNGDRLPVFQLAGFGLPIRIADLVIVHTETGRRALLRRGIAARKVRVVPHGPLRLHHVPSSDAADRTDRRYTFVLFGELKAYKGIDVFVEAIGRLTAAERERARFVIAGRPRMDLRPLRTRLHQLGLEQRVELVLRRLSEQEMADLFAVSDCFVFPYRQIDASGVYHLVDRLPAWLIASRVGVFAEDIEDGASGALVPPGDAASLARAMSRAIAEEPRRVVRSFRADWATIGRTTLGVYRDACGTAP